jgi:hypothetical protein
MRKHRELTLACLSTCMDTNEGRSGAWNVAWEMMRSCRTTWKQNKKKNKCWRRDDPPFSVQLYTWSGTRSDIMCSSHSLTHTNMGTNATFSYWPLTSEECFCGQWCWARWWVTAPCARAQRCSAPQCSFLVCTPATREPIQQEIFILIMIHEQAKFFFVIF